MSKIITYQTAKKARDLGFDIPCLFFYDGSEMIATCSSNAFDLQNYNTRKGSTIYSAPTQSLFQKFLREKYNIHIWVYPILLMKNNHEIECDSFDYTFQIIDKGITQFITKEHLEYKTFEDAFEIGLMCAVEKIIKTVK